MLDRSDPNQPTLQLLAGEKGDGTPVFEEVPVEDAGGGRYRILASPGLLDGLAAGDTFEPSADGRFRVAERSGNICVQVWYPGLALADRIDAELVPAVQAIGGWLDGRDRGVSAFTVPLTATFRRIESVFGDWAASADGAGWVYGNVYAEGSDDPLRWWDAEPFRSQLAEAERCAGQ